MFLSQLPVLVAYLAPLSYCSIQLPALLRHQSVCFFHKYLLVNVLPIASSQACCNAYTGRSHLSFDPTEPMFALPYHLLPHEVSATVIHSTTPSFIQQWFSTCHISLAFSPQAAAISLNLSCGVALSIGGITCASQLSLSIPGCHTTHVPAVSVSLSACILFHQHSGSNIATQAIIIHITT